MGTLDHPVLDHWSALDQALTREQINAAFSAVDATLGGGGGGSPGSDYMPLGGGNFSGPIGVPAPGINFPTMAANNANYQFAWHDNRIWPFVNTIAQGPLAYLSDLPLASETPPVMDGDAAVGVGLSWARADHIHPTDTSRYDADNPAGYQTLAQLNAAVTRVNVVPNAPACAITASASETTVANAPFKISFDTAEYDVTNGFDLVNHWFKPNVAGYYSVDLGVGITTTTSGITVSIYKNGAEYRRSTTGSSEDNEQLTALVHLNGSTDTLEGYVTTAAIRSTDPNSAQTWFSAVLVQAASS